jgi:hypothetical protein
VPLIFLPVGFVAWAPRVNMSRSADLVPRGNVGATLEGPCRACGEARGSWAVRMARARPRWREVVG